MEEFDQALTLDRFPGEHTRPNVDLPETRTKPLRAFRFWPVSIVLPFFEMLLGRTYISFLFIVYFGLILINVFTTRNLF